jgi:hypothetical protein
MVYGDCSWCGKHASLNNDGTCSPRCSDMKKFKDVKLKTAKCSVCGHDFTCRKDSFQTECSVFCKNNKRR